MQLLNPNCVSSIKSFLILNLVLVGSESGSNSQLLSCTSLVRARGRIYTCDQCCRLKFRACRLYGARTAQTPFLRCQVANEFPRLARPGAAAICFRTLRIRRHSWCNTARAPTWQAVVSTPNKRAQTRGTYY